MNNQHIVRIVKDRRKLKAWIRRTYVILSWLKLLWFIWTLFR
ncbi:MAG: hypothetical protein AB7F59_02310 [Bdellovibrionales bacterium]